MDKELKKNAVLRAKVDGYSSDGAGVARINGCVVFIPFAARGDVCDVRIVKVLKTHAFGIIERLITPSPCRTEPECPAFPKCGGCDFLHIIYEEELRLKAERVRGALSRIGGFDAALPEIVPSPQRKNARNKALFPLQKTADGVSFGFYRRRSHEVVPTADCALNHPDASRLAAVVAKWAEEFDIPIYDEFSGSGLLRKVYTRHGKGGTHLCVVAADELPHADRLVSLCREACPALCGVVLNINAARTNLALGEKCRTLWGEPALRDTLLGKSFMLSPLSFYQVNHAQAENLYKCVLELAAPDKGLDMLDLYCGIGTITLSAAPLCARIVGAEIVPRAIADARENAARNGVENAEFICADAGEAARELSGRGFAPACVICDPPRKGMDAPAIDAVLSLSPARIVYVACDPASLARDGKYLREHGYALSFCKCFDMFPRTANVETAALFTKGE